MSWLQLTFSALLLFVSISSFSEGLVQQSVQRIVVFGDSLSDTGTYAHVAGPQGGGKFTTNPAKIWVEYVADGLNLEAKPNRNEGFNLPTKFLGGTNYAQGGSRLVFTTDKNPDKPSASATPIATQVGYFLMENDQFKSTDLVLMQGGANDIFAQMNALAAGKVTPEEAIGNMVQAAKDFGSILANIKNSGAGKVVVLNLPQIETTPRVLALSAQVQGLVKMMVLQFNKQLQSEAKDLGIQLVDFYSFDAAFNKEHGKYGVENITVPACRVDVLPNNSALFCSNKTLISPDADQTHKFSDGVHPTAAYSKLVGEFISQQVK